MGMIVDTVGPDGYGLVSLTEKKSSSIQAMLEAMYNAVNRKKSARFVAQVAGKVISASPAFSPARPWTASFFIAIDAMNRAPWEWDNRKPVTVTEAMGQDARFLHSAMAANQGQPIWHSSQRFLLRWDASGSIGWGAALWTSPAAQRRGQQPIAVARGAWDQEMLHHHINQKETFALPKALQAFEHIISGGVVLPQGDSRTANKALSRFRGSVANPFRNQMAKEAWLWAQRTRTHLLPVLYVNTEENSEADEASRWIDYSDWVISEEAWQMVERAYGPHTWDRFASHDNKRTAAFTARHSQPGCQWPDALSQPWDDQNNYVCPPESLLLRALRHIRSQPGVEATVIAPTYEGVWAPLLRTMESSRILLPPPTVSFAAGPSGFVEPWKTLGHEQPRQYAAIRVRSPRSP